tara:strand:- start:2960 stop:3412 length:453 start_codon:yes stop_codon:yes gene_type:complete
MNHCFLELKVQKAPVVRYTPDNKTPIAELEGQFKGLRADDPPSSIKVVGWGRIAEEIQNSVAINQKLIVEGRLRMNTVPRQDGTKEKKAELTVSRLHFFPENNNEFKDPTYQENKGGLEDMNTPSNGNPKEPGIGWDSSPLVPDTDEIPF